MLFSSSPLPACLSYAAEATSSTTPWLRRVATHSAEQLCAEWWIMYAATCPCISPCWHQALQ